jgi:hypothetical protein
MENLLPRARVDARSSRRRRGSISILTAVAILVLVGLVGLGLDTALVLTARQQLQRTADAAALAGAAKLRTTTPADLALARQAAIATARSNTVLRCGASGIELADNPANDPDGEIVLGRWTFDRGSGRSVLVPTNLATGLPIPDSVQVRARCAEGSLNTPLELVFGPLFGTSRSNVGRSSIARLGGPDHPLILVLDPHEPASLRLDGGVSVDVLAGTIQVDSDDSCALRVNGESGRIATQRTRVVGEACFIDPANFTGDLIPHSPYVPDPLASLPEPTTAGMPDYGGISGPGTYAPGYYPGGIRSTGGTASLQPGVYFVGRAGGIDLSGSGSVAGEHVMLFVESGGDIRVTGPAAIQLTPPSSGTYAGVSVFMGRSGGASADIGGNASLSIDGAFYVPNGEMRIHGDVNATVGQFLVDTLRLDGNVRVLMTGNGIPPIPGHATVFLVN